MEIKSIKEGEIEYPKLNEISEEKIKTFIPDKWLKLGITSFWFNVLMKSMVYATTNNETDIIVVQNPGLYYNPVYIYIKNGCEIISWVSALTFIISVIIIIYKKIKAKKQEKNIKISKKIKITLIISIILFVLSKIGFLIVNYLSDCGIL